VKDKTYNLSLLDNEGRGVAFPISEEEFEKLGDGKVERRLKFVYDKIAGEEKIHPEE